MDLTGVDAHRVAELLALHTAEVEGVQEIGASIRDVVVGQVVACGRHPDADKLSVTKVDFGSGNLVDVVCGASNVRQGLKVAFAPVGACLPGGLKIKQAKLRGAPSQGMICSERELELSEEHAGIMELDPDAPLGARLVDFLGMSDWVLELDNKSLTHRPDLWGHYGFARELAAILTRPLQPLELRPDWPAAPSEWNVQLADQDCSHYLGVSIEVPAGPRPSPSWLRARLRAVGVKPRNDIVDLTNYVLLETGQPLHAFDAERLRGRGVVVRSARSGEVLRCLDETERSLTVTDLVVADSHSPVALAGVIGGLDSAVSPDSRSIFLEAAGFHPARVRRTSQRLALRTDASSRFEKSLDPLGAEIAARRYCQLLSAIRPDARVSAAPARAGLAASPARQITFDPGQCARLLGVDPGASATRGILERLGFRVQDASLPWTVEVPSWRATKDVTIAVDLVEEVGRMHGYDQIQASAWQAPVTPPQERPARLLARELASRLRGAHQAAESQSYSFITRRWAELLRLDPTSFLQLANPMQAGADLIRRDPIPSLLEQAAANVRERGEGRIFEIARGYEPRSGAEPRERSWVGMVEWCRLPREEQGPTSLFARARCVTEDLLRQAGAAAQVKASAEHDFSAAPWLHPAHALVWRHDGSVLGWSGRVDPRLGQALHGTSFGYSIVLLDLAAVQQAAAAQSAARFRSPPRLPAVKVDVALLLPVEKSYAEVEAAVRRAGGSLLESLDLFDLYQGPNIPTGQRSLAFHAVLRAADRTLEDKDEQGFIERVVKAAADLGGSLRS